MTESEAEEAATKIQAGYRGLVTREVMRGAGEAIRMPEASQDDDQEKVDTTEG